MRRADRLFQIIQILRRNRSATTADYLAVELEVSRRTVYRDISALMGQRVPIRGEAGTGYMLDDGYDLPPLMLTPDEIEAAVLGAQWVAGRGDPALAKAARDLVAKIGAAVPPNLRPFVLDPASGAAPRWVAPDSLDMAEVRTSIRSGRKIALSYSDEQGRRTERTVWPVAVGYHETVRILAAWCELRGAFRHFRTDRVEAADFLEERYPSRPGALRAAWRRDLKAQQERDMAAWRARCEAKSAGAGNSAAEPCRRAAAG